MKTTYYYWPSPPFLSGRMAICDDETLVIHVTGGAHADDLTVDCRKVATPPEEGETPEERETLEALEKAAQNRYALSLEGFRHFPQTKPYSDSYLTKEASDAALLESETGVHS